MVFADNGFRVRAATLLQSTSPFKSHSQNRGNELVPPNLPTPSQSATSLNEKPQVDGAVGRDKSISVSSNEKTLTCSGEDVVAQNQAAQRHVRTTPTWVRTIDEDDEEIEATSQLLPKAPPGARVAQHNNSPAAKQKHKHEPGRLHDAERECTPPIPRAPVTQTASRWREFLDASAYPAVSADGGEVVTGDWLLQNGADYSEPWLAGVEEDDMEKNGATSGRRAKRRRWWKRTQRMILRNPIVPLVIRMIVWSFSFVALVLGASIFHEFRKSDTSVQRATSPQMAIIVDAVALIYTVYITYDEYTSKPLGLRSAKAKMRLIFLDLFFIVFNSANLSLAFQVLNELPARCGPNNTICRKQKTLASVLFIALIAWLMTFAISVLRLMERVVHN